MIELKVTSPQIKFGFVIHLRIMVILFAVRRLFKEYLSAYTEIHVLEKID